MLDHLCSRRRQLAANRRSRLSLGRTANEEQKRDEPKFLHSECGNLAQLFTVTSATVEHQAASIFCCTGQIINQSRRKLIT